MPLGFPIDFASAPVLLDGAWGTQLQARGLPVGAAPDPWNLTHPELVGEVAAAYVAVGSQVILTNTFGANRITMASAGWTGSITDLNCAGAAISRQAAGSAVRVFGSVGPTGKMVTVGELDAEEAEAVFAEQILGLKAGGVDGIVVETMADLEEASAAVRAGVAAGLPVVASMVFDTGKDRDRTMMGVTIERAARSLAAAGASAVGANCGLGAELFLPLCERFAGATELPVWIKPNAGMPQLVDGRASYSTSPAQFADAGAALAAAGAAFVGGCCGTSPAFIAALKSALRRDPA